VPLHLRGQRHRGTRIKLAKKSSKTIFKP